MTLDDLWQTYCQHEYPALHNTPPTNALACFYLALLAFAENDLERATDYARRAADLAPDNRVYAAALVYLARVVAHGKTRVYVDGDAFAAFIRGGGNVGLYAAVNAALRTIYAAYDTLRLLDIGVGDGLALLPALPDNVARLDVIEPSAAMLNKTTAALEARQITYHAAQSTIQAFITASPPRDHWDIIQATWSLQSLPPAERPDVFSWCRAHGDRLLIAEFDVPAFTAPLAPDRVQYIVHRYERGLAEYDGDLVAQGFLMPVMFGYFDRSAERTNWEGPLSDWIDSLHTAGFTRIDTRRLFPYFWADAYLIDAH